MFIRDIGLQFSFFVTNYVTHINVLAATDGSQGPKNALCMFQISSYAFAGYIAHL